MLTNAVITFFNRYPDKEQKKMVYLPHRIDRAWYHISRKTTPSQGGLISSDEHMLRIPFDQCADWKPADQFATGQKGTCWTVQNGDLFIQGEWCGGEVMGIDDPKAVGPFILASLEWEGLPKEKRRFLSYGDSSLLIP